MKEIICECNRDNCNDCNDNPSDFINLSVEEKNILCEWILENLNIKTNVINERITSYGLKHKFERSKKGFYITNGCFKGAMIERGFLHSNGVNWCFNISNILKIES
ncbi:hypothetical protein [Clostridium butyricum]